jgi:hypothetical protein
MMPPPISGHWGTIVAAAEVLMSGIRQDVFRRRGLLAVTGCALVLMLGCHSFRLSLLSGDRNETKIDRETAAALVLPGKFSFRLAPYIFFSDFEVKRDLPIFNELAGLRDQVYKELQLPPGPAAVQVYLFEDRERFESFMRAKYPYLPRRRAFFVAQPRSFGGTEDLLVYTFWGDRIQKDLRHELTHALLHSVLKEVPIWLDEGLAEYFELPPENQGLNPAHVAILRHGKKEFKPDLGHLEGLSEVKDMGQEEYREAWAWAHLMLRGQPEGRAVLLAYLQQLRAGGAVGALGPKLTEVWSSPGEALEQHLAQLDTRTANESTPQR